MAKAGKKAGNGYCAGCSAALFLLLLSCAAIIAFDKADEAGLFGKKATGFSQLEVSDWNLAENGSLVVMLENNADENVSVKGINATFKERMVAYDEPVTIEGNGRQKIVIDGAFAAMLPGESNSRIDMQILYEDVKNGFAYLDTGSLIKR